MRVKPQKVKLMTAKTEDDFYVRDEEPPVDPDGTHLAAAMKLVYEVFKPSDGEKAAFEGKLVGELSGVG